MLDFLKFIKYKFFQGSVKSSGNRKYIPIPKEQKNNFKKDDDVLVIKTEEDKKRR